MTAVGVIMGSDSDWPVMKGAADALDEFDVPYEVRVVSAHRSPLRMVEYATTARDRGLQVIIAGAGGAAHLPGMVASLTVLPVIGIPVPTRHLGGVDSLHSIVQMPSGVPVATMAIGGAANAGLLAVRMLALADDELGRRLAEHQQGNREEALRWFERNRAACGPPGLYTEEYDVAQRQLRGNVPQAFVHAQVDVHRLHRRTAGTLAQVVQAADHHGLLVVGEDVDHFLLESAPRQLHHWGDEVEECPFRVRSAHCRRALRGCHPWRTGRRGRAGPG